MPTTEAEHDYDRVWCLANAPEAVVAQPASQPLAKSVRGGTRERNHHTLEHRLIVDYHAIRWSYLGWSGTDELVSEADMFNHCRMGTAVRPPWRCKHNFAKVLPMFRLLQ